MERRRRLAVHPVPYGRCVVQDLGGSYRVLRGHGVFTGAGAYEEFRRLAEVFQDSGSGMLVHPVWSTEQAWFASLTVEEEPLPDYVSYSFEFWEDWTGYGNGLSAVKESADVPLFRRGSRKGAAIPFTREILCGELQNAMECP